MTAVATEHPPVTPDPNADHVLKLLAMAVMGTESTYPVTLTVGGLVISGLLVSGHRYFDPISEFYGGAAELASKEAPPKDESIREVSELFKKFGDRYRADLTEDAPLPVYLHLIKAIIMAPGGQLIADVSWRGKISAVDGWSFNCIDPAGK